ncbi:MAG TPA: hypothetical protein VGJ20_36585 [Xanthobacteraceae bacterium]|jgi:hypothetical protein
MTVIDFPTLASDDKLFDLKDELEELNSERDRLIAAGERGKIGEDDYEACTNDIAARRRHIIEEILSCTPTSDAGEWVQFCAIASLAHLCYRYENGMDHFLDMMAKFAATRSSAKRLKTHEGDPPAA